MAPTITLEPRSYTPRHLVDGAIEYAEEIRRSGHYIVSNALQRTQTARTIRVRAGNAARFPPARVAVIEVRPVQELKHSRDRRGLPS